MAHAQIMRLSVEGPQGEFTLCYHPDCSGLSLQATVGGKLPRFACFQTCFQATGKAMLERTDDRKRAGEILTTSWPWEPIRRNRCMGSKAVAAPVPNRRWQDVLPNSARTWHCLPDGHH